MVRSSLFRRYQNAMSPQSKDVESFNERFEIRRLKLEDADEVADFMAKYFCPYVPIGQIFQVDVDLLRNRQKKLVPRRIKSNLSFGCYEK